MRKHLLWVSFLFLLASSVLASQLDVNFEEDGKIISYYEDYWVTNVNGTATITNPTNTTLYNVIIPFNLQPMTLIETSDTDYTDSSKILIPELGPYESATFDYKIVGIPFMDPMEQSRGVFRSSIIRLMRNNYGDENARIYSNIMGILMKGPVENQSYPGTGTRLVTVVLRNPTPFYYNISSIRVIKTIGMDPNRNVSTGWLNEWQFPDQRFGKTILYPGDEYHIDVLDTNATEGEIYWLSSDVYIPDIFINGTNTVRRLTQNDVLVFEGELVETLENGTNVTLLEQPMFIQKKISKSVVNPGDDVQVDLVITNLGFKTREVLVKDSYPYGFTLSSSLENVTGRNMSFSRKIPPQSPLILKYTLHYEDEKALGLDYFPAAEMYYDDQVLYTQTIPFVRKYVPEKVLYVQKSLKYSLNDELVVSVDLTNLGQTPVENVVLKEYLSSDNVFREISRQPYAKGVWKIPEINPGETWTVSYVTNEHNAINLLPEVFGVSSNFVMKSLLMENVIRSDFRLGKTSLIEFVGLAVIVLLPVLWYFLHKRTLGEKVRQTSALGDKIRDLKRKTEMRPQDRIDRLLRESRPEDYQPRHPVKRRSHASREDRISEIQKHIDEMKKNP